MIDHDEYQARFPNHEPSKRSARPLIIMTIVLGIALVYGLIRMFA